ncbi:Na+/H+ antiporter subunit E [Ornithinimicrobium sufpigmenti]|uniref:Na+/H+ antiporter subunit E n=1 Tax=Ornithinimicrobium sufpigmenti TaxID=2508882 RepID=UPI0010364FF1|nr:MULTISPECIES: Na+/H+ antiporter subunit E [unclassified Ornithinimicrobium]
MRWVVAVLLRGLVLAALWWVLVEGRARYAGYGLAAVPLALVVSLWLVPAGGFALGPRPTGWRQVAGRTGGVLALVGWYARQVVAGGVDVARRLLRREPDVAPVVRRTRFHLPPGPARQLAVGMYGLMPGAVVSGTDGDLVWLHSLDAAMHPERQWLALEERIARAAGLDLTDQP